MRDIGHLVALNAGLYRERERLANAKTSQEKELRSVWVAQIEKEVAHEIKFLGVEDIEANTMNDDDLLSELV